MARGVASLRGLRAAGGLRIPFFRCPEVLAEWRANHYKNPEVIWRCPRGSRTRGAASPRSAPDRARIAGLVAAQGAIRACRGGSGEGNFWGADPTNGTKYTGVRADEGMNTETANLRVHPFGRLFPWPSATFSVVGGGRE